MSWRFLLKLALTLILKQRCNIIADVFLTKLPSRIHQSGWTALSVSTLKGFTEIVWLLIRHGAQINAQTEVPYLSWSLSYHRSCPPCRQDGLTVLMIACQRGHSAIALALIEAGANVNTQAYVICNPVVSSNPLELFDLLLTNNCSSSPIIWYHIL